jgi:hypothetical protein
LNWIENANCRSVPTSVFFEDYENAPIAERVKILSICAECSVRKECENYADSNSETYGVWGGHFYKKGKKRDALKVSQIKTSAKSAGHYIL